jgi:predicted butyrate kinase (DUF1464 family)
VYPGDADSGYIFMATLTKASTKLTLEVKGAKQDDIFTINLPTALTGFNVGDVIKLSTLPGNKYANVTRAGTVYNLLGTLVGSLSSIINQDTVSATFTDATNTTSSTSTSQISYKEKHIGF